MSSTMSAALNDVEGAMSGSVADVDAAYAALYNEIDAVIPPASPSREHVLTVLKGSHLMMRRARTPGAPNYAGTPPEDAAMADAVKAALLATYFGNGGTI